MFRITRFFSKKKEKETIPFSVQVAGLGGAGTLLANKMTKKHKKLLEKLDNEHWYLDGKLGAEDSSLLQKLQEQAEKGGVKHKADKRSYYNPLKNLIGHGGNPNSAAVFAHELGHAYNFDPNKTLEKRGFIKNGLYKLHHGIEPVGRTLLNHMNQHPKTVLGHGMLAGYTGEAMKEDNKGKPVMIHEIGSRVLPAAIVAPVLVEEALASKKGLKFLKNHGASKEYLKEAKNSLKNAFGTYAAAAAKPIGINEVGIQFGRLGRKTQNLLNKNNND